jgi:hypothetical protein
MKYAGDIIDETHGDYSGFNAPRPFHWGDGSFGRVALQFRKFSAIMYNMYRQEIIRAFAGATTEEKIQGARALFFLSAHSMVWGGTVGQFGASVFGTLIAALFNAFDGEDDDDWQSWRNTYRNWLGAGRADSSWWSNFLYKGAPYAMGIDLSERVGMGNVLSLAPYTGLAETFDDSKGFNETAGKLLMGATGGLAGKMINGWGMGVEHGEWERFVESVVPSGIGNVMKMYRLKTRGLTNKHGDVLIPASDISWPEAIAVGTGVTPRKLADQSEIASEKFEVTEHHQKKTTLLKDRWTQAAKSGDPRQKSKVVDAWNKEQEARVRDGLPRQKMSVLRGAVKEQHKRERMTAGGVQYDKATKKFVQKNVEPEPEEERVD